MEAKTKSVVSTEYYVHLNPPQYWRGKPHTDTVSAIDSAPNGVVIYDEVLTMEEYDNTILANCGLTHKDFGWHDEDRVRVVVYQL